ncbi:MAG TPA: hypothetical protein VHG90_12085 [Acidimicrobiales bacterium]|nr:hypothetical protein [Acidimicrobiales bacterium]
MTIDDCCSSPLDEGLLQAYRSIVARTDPVPPEVVAAARAALSWRTIDGELAELLALPGKSCISEPLARS